MTRALLLFALLLVPSFAFGHGGEDHGAGGAQATASATGATTSALSRRFEVVLKHAPVRGGQPYRGVLYLADFATNAPVAGAAITVEEPGVNGRPFTVRAGTEPGVYLVERPAGFARDGEFSVVVRVRSGQASDLLLLQHVYIGPVKASGTVTPTSEASAAGAQEGLPWAWLLIVLALGVAFAAWLVVMARKRRQAHPSEPVPADASLASGARPMSPSARP